MQDRTVGRGGYLSEAGIGRETKTDAVNVNRQDHGQQCLRPRDRKDAM